MKRELQSYTDEQNRKYVEEHMPVEFIGKHHSKHNGTPIRMAVYDETEDRKFIVDSNKLILRMSDAGKKGLVAFCDYYVKEDNGLDIGFMYVHPFHRNKNISNNMALFFEELIPLTATLDAYNVSSEYVEKLIANATNRRTINVRTFEYTK